jgi:SH3 domain-containing protein
VRARQSTARGSVLATLIVVASWLVVPAWLPGSDAIPVVEAVGCRSGSHQLSAGDPAASPMSGTTLTTIAFSVVVSDTGGCVPSTVELRIPGLPALAMSPAGGTIRSGLTYQVSTQLPVGSWSWGFHIANGSKAGFQTVDVAGAGTIRITSAATPTPTPKPTPTPTPTPKPTPKPTPTPTPKPTSTTGPGPTASPPPTPRPTSASTASPRATTPGHSQGPSPSPRPTGTPSSPSGAGGPGGGSGGSGPGAPGASVPLGMGPLGVADRDHGSLADAGPGAVASPTPGVPGPTTSGAPATAISLPFDVHAVLPVILWASTSATGVVLFAIVLNHSALPVGNGSLAIFAMDRRRRRQTERASVVGGSTAPSDKTEPAASLEAAADGPDATPWMARPGHVPLRFASPAGRGVERRTVGYRQVRVSAGPDDIRTPEVGRVDRGDEIEVIGEDPSYFQIRTPDGVEGWVPRFVILGGG